MRNLFLMIAALGFCYQSIEISIDYFAFQILFRIKQDRSKNVRPISINVCVPYEELMRQESVNFTITGILNQTPAKEKLIGSCRYRDYNNVMRTHTASYCNEKFSLRKNFVQDFICYHLYQKDRKPGWIMALISHSIEDPHVIAEFTLSEVFANVSRILAISSGRNVPADSRDFSQIVHRDRNATTGLAITITPRYGIIYYLPFPYESYCIQRVPKQPQPYHGCLWRCLFPKVINGTGKAPFTQFVTEQLDLQPISHKDTRDKLIAKSLKDSYKECKGKCDSLHHFCDWSVTLSSIQKEVTREPGIRISMHTQWAPDLISQAVPQVDLVKYFSLVTSSMSVWFGASFASLGMLVMRCNDRKRSTFTRVHQIN